MECAGYTYDILKLVTLIMVTYGVGILLGWVWGRSDRIEKGEETQEDRNRI